MTTTALIAVAAIVVIAVTFALIVANSRGPRNHRKRRGGSVNWVIYGGTTKP